MTSIAIMQGRLGPPEEGRFQSFPRDGWREEFARASEAGLDAIEWIYDTYGESVNPLNTVDGIAEIRTLSERHGVRVKSVCADYFMDVPIVRAEESTRQDLLHRLTWLMEQCRLAGISRLVLPFVDAARIQSKEDEPRAIAFIQAALPAAVASGVEIHLETDLGPAAFAGLLSRLDSPFIKANYDSGNSASLGYKPGEELRAYGSRIGSVHVKDRLFGGGTVPPGTGNADLPALFRGLALLDYRGDYVLQVARRDPGDETAWAAQNLNLLRDYLKAARSAS